MTDEQFDSFLLKLRAKCLDVEAVHLGRFRIKVTTGSRTIITELDGDQEPSDWAAQIARLLR